MIDTDNRRITRRHTSGIETGIDEIYYQMNEHTQVKA